MKGKLFTIKFRRKREGKTDYKGRRRLLLSGKPRVVVRKSLKNITAQLIEYSDKGDKVIASASSRNLEKFGWKTNKSNLPAAYLTGFLLGSKVKDKVEGCIIDLGLSYTIKGSKEFALIKGIVDSGLKVSYSEGIFPSEDRLKGAHIAKYAESVKGDKKKFERLFSDYVKKGVDPTNLTKIFDEVKLNIGKVK